MKKWIRRFSLPVLVAIGIVFCLVGGWWSFYVLDDASNNPKSVDATKEVISGGINIVDAWDATDPPTEAVVVTTPPRGGRECPGIKVMCGGKCVYPEYCPPPSNGSGQDLTSPSVGDFVPDEDPPAEEVVFPPTTIVPEEPPMDLQLPDDWQEDTDTVGSLLGGDPSFELRSVVISHWEDGRWIATAYLPSYYDELAQGLLGGDISAQVEYGFRPGLPPDIMGLSGRHPSQMVPMITDTGEVVVIPLGQAVLEMGPPTQLAPLPADL